MDPSQGHTPVDVQNIDVVACVCEVGHDTCHYNLDQLVHSWVHHRPSQYICHYLLLFQLQSLIFRGLFFLLGGVLDVNKVCVDYEDYHELNVEKEPDGVPVLAEFQPFEVNTSTVLDIILLSKDEWNVPLNLEEDVRPIGVLGVGVVQLVSDSENSNLDIV